LAIVGVIITRNLGKFSGSDEGVYAWVVANHALGSLGGEPLKTTGIVELGGASAQVLSLVKSVIDKKICV
jgi:Golgi nucleoside diphosphatase